MFTLESEELEWTKNLFSSYDLYWNEKINDYVILDVFSKPLSITLIPLFYKFMYKAFFSNYILTHLPKEYEEYEKRIYNDYQFYQLYGQILKQYYHVPYSQKHLVADYIRRELDNYKFGLAGIEYKYEPNFCLPIY